MKKMNHNRKIDLIQRKKGPYSYRKPPVNNWVKTIFVNRFFFAIFSGIIVGLIFGIISLHLLTENGQPLSANQNVENTTPSSAQAKEMIMEETISLPTVYVVQLGLFHEAQNANISKDEFKSKQIDAVIWNREGEYYIFHSVYLDEQKAKEQAKELLDKGIESFVKAWPIDIELKHMTQNEIKQIESMLNLWESSMKRVESSQALSINDWNEWIKRDKADSSLLQNLEQNLKKILDKHDVFEDRTILLEIIKEVDQSVKGI